MRIQETLNKCHLILHNKTIVDFNFIKIKQEQFTQFSEDDLVVNFYETKTYNCFNYYHKHISPIY